MDECSVTPRRLLNTLAGECRTGAESHDSAKLMPVENIVSLRIGIDVNPLVKNCYASPSRNRQVKAEIKFKLHIMPELDMRLRLYIRLINFENCA